MTKRKQDAGYGRKPTLAQARALAAERALSDALAEGLRAFVELAPAPIPDALYALASDALARYDAARGGT